MDISQFKKLQQEFDDQYIGHYEGKPEEFLFLATALSGEVGEFANLVKKHYRQTRMQRVVEGDQERDLKQEMKKEMTDVFCYFLIIANMLDLDVDKYYLENLERNKKRFQKIDS